MNLTKHIQHTGCMNHNSRILTGKTHRQIKLQRLEKANQLNHYIKSIISKRFLN